MHTCMDDRSGIYLEQVRLRRALVMILGSRPRRINVRGAATTSHTFGKLVVGGNPYGNDMCRRYPTVPAAVNI
jgi:hypothetical protein